MVKQPLTRLKATFFPFTKVRITLIIFTCKNNPAFVNIFVSFNEFQKYKKILQNQPRRYRFQDQVVKNKTKGSVHMKEKRQNGFKTIKDKVRKKLNMHLF